MGNMSDVGDAHGSGRGASRASGARDPSGAGGAAGIGGVASLGTGGARARAAREAEPREPGAARPDVAARRVGRRRSDRLVGVSRAAEQTFEQAAAAARSALPVVIRGPDGAGKSFLARAIHAWSEHREAPFVERSCASLPPALQGRELFGCAAGVHTALPGAYAGALAESTGGTLLLSEVERLEAGVWKRLIEALGQEGYLREGEEARQPLRARVIVTQETSDASLLGTLPHHEIALPSLVERAEDILPLAAHFLAEYADEEGLPAVGFTEDARAALLSAAWPGNVRELRERVRQALRLVRDGAVTAEALMLAADHREIPSFKDAKRAFEARYVEGLLRRCDGNISRAARLAKKDRKDFYDVIRRTGIDPREFRR